MKKSSWSLGATLLAGVAPLIVGLIIYFFFTTVEKKIDAAVYEYAEDTGIPVEIFEYGDVRIEAGEGPEREPSEPEVVEEEPAIVSGMSNDELIAALRILNEMDAATDQAAEEKSQMSEWLMLIGGINSMLMGWATLFLRRREE